MLRHLVLLKFADTAAPAAIAGIVAAFAALPAQIPTVTHFEHGTDVSPEGLAKGFTHAFLLGFADAAGRDAYLPHPAHEAFVARLRPLIADVLVVDYWS